MFRKTKLGVGGRKEKYSFITTVDNKNMLLSRLTAGHWQQQCGCRRQEQARAGICRFFMFLKHFLLSSQHREKALAVQEQALGFRNCFLKSPSQTAAILVSPSSESDDMSVSQQVSWS